MIHTIHRPTAPCTGNGRPVFYDGRLFAVSLFFDTFAEQNHTVMPRLSLIIATYNRSAELIRALESVAAQSADPSTWECVAVDNNSTDDTAARFAEFAARYPALPIRMVRETRQGLSYARNRGIAETSGEYIAIIDDDEHINRDFISAYIELFDSHPDAASAGGRIIAEYPSGRPAWMSRWTEQPIANPIDLGNEVREFPAGRIPGGGNMALRRSAVERYGAFDTSLGRSGGKLTGGEESDLFQRLARGGERCMYAPQAVMWHVIPAAKLTDEYFDRLACNIGATQRLRAQAGGRLTAAAAAECAKWVATLAIAAWYTLCGRTAQARYLVRMRRRITAGFFNTAQTS